SQQVRSQVCFPARHQPLLARMVRSKAVVSVGCRGAREAASGCVPIGADPLQCEPVALGDLPVDAGKTGPLRSRARRRSEQSGQLFQTGSRMAGCRNTEIVGIGLVFALAQPRTQKLDLRVVRRGNKKEFVRVLHRGQTRIIALIAIESSKPEELVAADRAARA